MQNTDSIAMNERDKN